MLRSDGALVRERIGRVVIMVVTFVVPGNAAAECAPLRFSLISVG